MIDRRWWPPLAWAALILVCTSLPASVTPAAPVIPGLDKGVHFSLYAVFGWLCMRASGRRARTLLPWILALATFGALDEWHQHFIIGRSPELLDWFADLAGSITGLATATAAPMRREHVT